MKLRRERKSQGIAFEKVFHPAANFLHQYLGHFPANIVESAVCPGVHVGYAPCKVWIFCKCPDENCKSAAEAVHNAEIIRISNLVVIASNYVTSVIM